jgi:hypothetical protein
MTELRTAHTADLAASRSAPTGAARGTARS